MTFLIESLPFPVTPVSAILIGLYLLWVTEREAKAAPSKTPAE